MSLKSECFPVRWGKFERKYLNVNALHNSEGTGIKQKITPYENVIFKKTFLLIEDMRKDKISKSKIEEHYQWLNSYVTDMFKKEFELNLKI